MLEDFSDLKKDLRDYIDIRIKQIKLSLAEITSRIVSRVLSTIIIIWLIILFLLFLSFSGAYFIGDLLNSNHLGFLCVAGFYLMSLIIFILFRRYFIDRRVIRSVISMFFPKSGEDENE